MDAPFPRWVALRDVRPFDVIAIRGECVTVSHISEADSQRRNVSGTILNKRNIPLYGSLVLVPQDEMVLLVARSSKERSWTPATSVPIQRPPED